MTTTLSFNTFMNMPHDSKKSDESKPNIRDFFVEMLTEHPTLLIQTWVSISGRYGEYEIVTEEKLREAINNIFDAYENA